MSCGLVTLLAASSSAAEQQPQIVARFTRHVQPLVINKCAAGACHGGPSAPQPRFHRGDAAGYIDRTVTLLNMDALTAATRDSGDVATFLATLSRRHPSGTSSRSLRLTPLTPAERTALEQWLLAASEMEGSRATTSMASRGTKKVTVMPQPQHNRFRALLDAEANPLPLPPPREPDGIILGKERAE